MSANVIVTPRQLHRMLLTCLEVDQPVLVVGAPGQGKSEIALQAISDYGADVAYVHGVSMLPTDTRGLGAIAADRTYAQWLPYGDMLRMINAQSPLVTLLDDIGQAPISVQSSLMQPLQARRMNDWKISKHVRFILTTNRREDKAGVQAVIEPLKGRCLILELENSIQDWARWAIAANIPAEIISFYLARPELLNKFSPSADITNSPTARQAANVGKIYKVATPQDRLALFAGLIGKPAAIELMAHLDMIDKVPNLDGIIMDPLNAALPAKNPSIEYATIAGLISKTTIGNFANIMTYVDRLPNKEYQAFYVQSATRDSIAPNQLKNTRTYIQWVATNQWLFN